MSNLTKRDAMESSSSNCEACEGEIIAVLLDQDEYSSNVGSVAVVSDQQLCLLRHDRHELIHYRSEFFEMADCIAIEYQDKMVYYRMVIGVALLLAAAVSMFMLVTDSKGISSDSTPLLFAAIMFLTIGVRFITSTHRHIIYFEMPDEILKWRSPAIDYKYKAEAARAVRDFAKERGILREAAK